MNIFVYFHEFIHLSWIDQSPEGPRDLENHLCSFSIINVQGKPMNHIHFMHYPLVAEYPDQQAIVEKRFYVSIDY